MTATPTPTEIPAPGTPSATCQHCGTVGLWFTKYGHTYCKGCKRPAAGAHPATDTRLPAPMELQALAQWVLWKWARVGAKWTKPPYQVNGRKASHSDPATWTTYADACAHEEGYDGLGFVLTSADLLAVVDLDKCREPKTGDIAPWAQAVIDRFSTYSEASPTGTGVHIILRGVLPGTGHKKAQEDGGAVEVYDRLRYVTVSGRSL